MVRRAVAALVRWTGRVARAVTAVAMFLGLLVAYFAGVLLVRVLAPVFARGLLRPRRRSEQPSYWQEARGLSAERDDLLYPS